MNINSVKEQIDALKRQLCVASSLRDRQLVSEIRQDIERLEFYLYEQSDRRTLMMHLNEGWLSDE